MFRPSLPLQNDWQGSTMLARNFAIEHAEDPDITQEVFAFSMMPSRLRLRLRSMD